MLQLIDIHGGYRQRTDKWILHGIDMELKAGQTIAVIGKNGAGKSTLAKSIVNLLPYKSGKVIFDGKDITRLPTEKMMGSGIAYFNQGGQVFPQLTPLENLRFAGRHLKKEEWNSRLKELTGYFEILKPLQGLVVASDIQSYKVQEKKDRALPEKKEEEHSQILNIAATWLSGGQRHQLALAMALITNPQFLILDEPSAGLSTGNVQKIYAILKRIRDEKGVGILLIEQNVKQAAQFAEEIWYLERGRFIKRFQKENINDIHQFFLK